MSVLQVSNLHFESSGNNRLQYTGSNSYNLVGGGSVVATINTTSVDFPLDLVANNVAFSNISFEATGNNRIEYAGSNTWQFVAGGANVATINTTSTIFSGSIITNSLNNGQLAGLRNRIINGAMMIAQRNTSFTGGTTNADDVYTLDRWVLLSDGNDAVDVTQSTEAPADGLNSIALDVETANKKFGILQIIEQKNCIGLIGNTVTLSFKAKASSTTKLDNLKAAIISWDGTADSVTSDIVSAWGAEDTNPTLVANWTYENSPANLTPTTSWASYSVSAAVDTASTKNIAVFIWSDVTDTTAGDFLYITDVQLEAGSSATPFEQRSIGVELALCQRYYQIVSWGINGYVNAGFIRTKGSTTFPPMRVTPTVTRITEGASQVNIRGGAVITYVRLYGVSNSSAGYDAESQAAGMVVSETNVEALSSEL